MQSQYDVIVIGSGIGGLAAAGLLARQRRARVLVLEQHFTPGGMTHCFTRKSRFQFDVGLHYVGEMGPGTLPRTLLDYLTDGRLEWTKMPHRFERFVYPDFEFEVPADVREYRAALQERFPAERRAITRYFRDVAAAARWYTAAQLAEALPWPLRLATRAAVAAGGSLIRTTTGAYLERNFRDPKLRALLTSHWGDYGLAPARSSFGIHALVTGHYFGGAWFPRGGARTIAEAMLPGIEAAGGAVLTRSRVDRILVEDGRAVGVLVSDPHKARAGTREYRAPLVISDAGAQNTYGRLLEGAVDVPFRAALAAVPRGPSAVTVFLGLRESPARLGTAGENHWLFDHYDHDRIHAGNHWDEMCYLSFPSLKDPEARGHTAQIISLVDATAFAQWAGSTWKRRGEDYEALKTHVAETLLARVERRLPGFRALVEYVEVATPLTFETFQGAPGGAFYGVPATPERLGKPWTSVRTPVENLLLTGTDVTSLGIVGAMMGGVKTAAMIEGALGFPKIVRAAQRSQRGAARLVTA